MQQMKWDDGCAPIAADYLEEKGMQGPVIFCLRRYPKLADVLEAYAGKYPHYTGLVPNDALVGWLATMQPDNPRWSTIDGFREGNYRELSGRDFKRMILELFPEVYYIRQFCFSIDQLRHVGELDYEKWMRAWLEEKGWIMRWPNSLRSTVTITQRPTLECSVDELQRRVTWRQAFTAPNLIPPALIPDAYDLYTVRTPVAAPGPVT